MNIFKQPVVIGIVILAIIIPIIWSYIDKRQQTKQMTQNATTEVIKIIDLSNVDPTDFDSAAKDELTLADSKASLANQNNKLAAIEIELPATLAPNGGNSRYIYSSSNDTANNWVISISQSSHNYVRSLIPKDDYMGNLQAIDTALWKFNYVTAFQIAEKNGGLEWREKNKPTGVTITLRHEPPKNWLEWSVKYTNTDSSLIKVIDANSGQIIDDTAASGETAQ